MIAWLITKKPFFFIPFSEDVKVFLDMGLCIQDELEIRHYRGYTADHYGGFKYRSGIVTPFSGTASNSANHKYIGLYEEVCLRFDGGRA